MNYWGMRKSTFPFSICKPNMAWTSTLLVVETQSPIATLYALESQPTSLSILRNDLNGGVTYFIPGMAFQRPRPSSTHLPSCFIYLFLILVGPSRTLHVRPSHGLLGWVELSARPKRKGSVTTSMTRECNSAGTSSLAEPPNGGMYMLCTQYPEPAKVTDTSNQILTLAWPVTTIFREVQVMQTRTGDLSQTTLPIEGTSTNSHKTVHAPLVAGAVVGGVAFLILFAICLWILCRARQKPRLSTVMASPRTVSRPEIDNATATPPINSSHATNVVATPYDLKHPNFIEGEGLGSSLGLSQRLRAMEVAIHRLVDQNRHVEVGGPPPLSPPAYKIAGR
ncbi:hypothetical protein DL96DRAFT_324686 [Flagelloscypha sp. PMI_526]|nr:hypothetical protein DL96DRAFT_324686 [Flagelloscypha sp. PMI_526]